jgi:hypothetical protein
MLLSQPDGPPLSGQLVVKDPSTFEFRPGGSDPKAPYLTFKKQ